MAKTTIFSLCFLSFLILCSTYVEGKTWCVAQVGASKDRLNQFINDVCLHLACEPIMPGGSCFEPDNIYNHGSYAINLNYRATGECDTSFATPATTDPSFLRCHYP
ncbi:X8 domain-containing protein [Artemisia annua]|uniref:X8 domain-containing protein n=1 Tax=Artemisia annua TaxID=35608 RepID=A0A2U1KMP8_ARTAN|nr:X8 domain-containing protein [Artemisia annua]PWA48657.1 X8 domain-containing protein [Artemisia annua]